MKAKSLEPQYAVGTVVEYTDREARRQVGKVRAIEGKWFHAEPYLIYELAHPTYRNGRFYTGPKSIIGEANNDDL